MRETFERLYSDMNNVMGHCDPSQFFDFLASDFRLILADGQVVPLATFKARMLEARTRQPAQLEVSTTIHRLVKLAKGLYEARITNAGNVCFEGLPTPVRVESQCFDTWKLGQDRWRLSVRIKQEDLYHERRDLFGLEAEPLVVPA